jgi:parallel beta-helix repeat protein
MLPGTTTTATAGGQGDHVMLRSMRYGLVSICAIGALGALYAPQAAAFGATLTDWKARYGAISSSGDSANCQLCHVNSNGGAPWNGYGWNIREAKRDAACDLNGDATISNAEAFYCVEQLNSDRDGSDYSNLFEIGVSTQPGWTAGPSNVYYSIGGTLPNQLPPSNIGKLDPDGTEPPPPVEPPPPTDPEPLPPGQRNRQTIVVKPGQSIQKAIDQAAHGARIYVLAGVYRETADPVNGLRINKSGIHLIGQNTPGKRVVLENAGNQSNGIVIVPSARNDCMGCHESMAPPFKLKPGVDPTPMDATPELYDIEVRGITIRNFRNNGLFTERVDGFRIVDVHSNNNRNYGIFPTLSRNGLIAHSRADGADDSGIWVETSENVQVSRNVVTGNTNGFEVSNSDDIELSNNVANDNTVGFAILLLPDIFDNRAGARRIDVRNNQVLDNNKPNTARPGSILATVPPGTGILYLGVDQSEVSGNVVKGNKFTGIALADYCLTVDGPPFACDLDPTVTLPFILDQAATQNRVTGNVATGNGYDPGADNPFGFAASDLTLLTFPDAHDNCFADNDYDTFFSVIGLGNPPGCP